MKSNPKKSLVSSIFSLPKQINLSYIRYLSRYSETDFALKNDSYNSLYFENILLIQFVTSDLSVASAIYSSPDKRLNEKSSSPS